MKFETYFEAVTMKDRGLEKFYFTCELTNPDKIEMLRKELAAIESPLERKYHMMEFTLKYGDNRVRYREGGMVVFNNHEYAFERVGENIVVTFADWKQQIFTPETEIIDPVEV